jgi:hypothetical protein
MQKRSCGFFLTCKDFSSHRYQRELKQAEVRCVLDVSVVKLGILARRSWVMPSEYSLA